MVAIGVLLSFHLENHRSIRDEQAFSMEPSRVEDDGTAVREEDGDRALAVAAIYGPNASGKSNLLGGFAFMRSVVVHSHRFYPPDGGVPRTAFAWGEKATEPSFFEASFRTDGIRYEYGFVTDDSKFREEWLYAYPLGRKQMWFERDGDEFRYGEHLKGENRLAEKVTRPNSLFLSAAAQNHHEQLLPVFHWFSAMRTYNLPVNVVGPSRRRLAPDWLLEDQFVRWWGRSSRRDSLSYLEGESMSDDDTRSTRFLELLRAADFGIVDLRVGDESGRSSSGVMVKHRREGEDAWLPLEEESHGTKQLFRVAPQVLDALAQGSVVLLDELDASLHPLLVLQIVRAFGDPRQNPRNAQLIFSTHDTNLLGTSYETNPLRRDQVWLTEKDENGSSRIYPLTDYKPRKAENLERGYLQGRYGAIPFIRDLAKPESSES